MNYKQHFRLHWSHVLFFAWSYNDVKQVFLPLLVGWASWPALRVPWRAPAIDGHSPGRWWPRCSGPGEAWRSPCSQPAPSGSSGLGRWTPQTREKKVWLNFVSPTGRFLCNVYHGLSLKVAVFSTSSIRIVMRLGYWSPHTKEKYNYLFC